MGLKPSAVPHMKKWNHISSNAAQATRTIRNPNQVGECSQFSHELSFHT